MNFTELRTLLLKNDNTKEFENIVEYMKNPYLCLDMDTIKILDQIGYNDFHLKIRCMFEQTREIYRNKIALGQVVLWEKSYKAYCALKKVKVSLEKMEVIVYSTNYMKATEQVLRVLKMYANAKAAITELENELGVDRYLDNVAEEEFNLLVNVFDQIHRIAEDKLKVYKRLYVKNWNTTNIYSILMHRLLQSNMDNQICSLFSAGKNRIFLFIIDGFGMGQYYWSQKVVPVNKNYSYSENVFQWLKNNSLSEEYVLGAPFVSDTAAGISQIFIGKTAKETRIFASNMKKYGSSKVIGVKSECQNEFRQIADTSYDSFTVDISSRLDEMKIYYCSKYNSDYTSGFSQYVFDSADVCSIIPSERVFSFLKDDFKNKKSGAIVTYITNIDNSGHIMGSFSQFERYEHEKINLLLKNFLIDLAKTQPEVFDGSNSILLTADHGMTESYRINISRKDIIDVIHSVKEHAGKIIEANRALLIYEVTDGGIEKCKTAINKYFKNQEIEAMVLSSGDELFDDFMPGYSNQFVNTTPDIVILLISEGIFYSNNVGEKLMHFGGHGGHSVDEVFVPAISIELNSDLLKGISERFLKNVGEV